MLGCITHLFRQRADIVYRVIACGIELEDIEGSIVAEGKTGTAFAAGFHVLCRVFAVDRTGQDTGTGRFTNSPRAAKQVSMCEMLCTYSVLKCSGNMLLPNNGIKSLRTVFTG